MSSAPQYTPRYTVQDYQLWDGDWELWNGTAVAMTPSPFGHHSEMLARLISALIDAVDKTECDATVLPELDWVISSDTVVRPDLSVVCGPAPKKHLDRPPALIAEVLSQATRERDLNHKRLLYQQQKVAWYLICDPESREIKAFMLSPDETYAEVELGEFFELTLCKDCKLNVDLRRVRR